ncbi:hypothetical protein ACH3VR_08070 [Microbacterium sp. B2969]|uniref:Uncharacterized protein n=1 Tax=Microbacterium alkaliflavum TaxID=3248839 RepID=A0ABW7Q9T2_9MICO
MGRRGWGILIGAVVIVIVVGVAAAVLLDGRGEAAGEATSTPTESVVSPTLSATPSPTPTPSLTSGEAPADVSCQSISRTAVQQMMTENGWVSWETQSEQIGARPFDRFPGGAPAGHIVCRWGESPDLATDNIIDLAWSPIEPDAATAAQQLLVTEGYQSIDAPEGLYLAMTGAGTFADDEGWGETYLFTADDVRWAMTKADVAYVKAPDEDG